jgi:hypothetical protein
LTPPCAERLHQKLMDAESATWDRLPGLARGLAKATRTRWYGQSVLMTARQLGAAIGTATAGELVAALGGTDRFAGRFAVAATAAGILSVTCDATGDENYHWKADPVLRYRPVDLPPLPPSAEFGQIPCTPTGRQAVAELVIRDFPWGGRILLLGDDDLIAPGLAATGYAVTVLDVDPRLAPILTERSVRITEGDIRRLPADLDQRFDAVICDPADNSVALLPWLRAAARALTDQAGARLYLSISPVRLGHRWPALVADAINLGLVPADRIPRCKEYLVNDRLAAVTDCWVFERFPALSHLPLPYLDIETFR